MGCITIKLVFFRIFNGTENITTFEIPISAFFLEEESQKLINATNGNFQNQATDIINSISDAHEQEVMEIVKQFKSTRRKRKSLLSPLMKPHV